METQYEAKYLVANEIDPSHQEKSVIPERISYAFSNYIQNGLGADLVRLTCLINKCEINNQKLFFPAGDVWKHTPKSSQIRNWSYYFEPTLIEIDETNMYPRIMFKHFVDKTTVPDNKKHMSKFQCRSEIMQKLYKPRSVWLNLAKQQIKHNLPELLTSEYALIHIRRGDKVKGPWQESKLIPTTSYLEALKSWYLEEGLKKLNVFIMSDSDEVVEDIKQLEPEYNEIGINFVWDRSEKRRDGYSYKLEVLGYEDEEIIDEMVTNMKNLCLMRHAKKLIGARSSFLFIAGELLNGNKGISLEDNKRYPTDIE